ncbi:6656_t:CDS:1, partial [Scutellospora calospora]
MNFAVDNNKDISFIFSNNENTNFTADNNKSVSVADDYYADSTINSNNSSILNNYISKQARQCISI